MLSMLTSFYDPIGLASPFILKGRLILQGLCPEDVSNLVSFVRQLIINCITLVTLL